MSTTETNIEKIRNLSRSDCRLTMREIPEIVQIYKESVRQVLHRNRNMEKVCAKMVPRILTMKQKKLGQCLF